MLLAILALVLPTASAACPEPTPVAELTSAVDDAVLSFATLDEEGFIEATDSLNGDVLCLSEVASPSAAASIHRTLAMRAFWDGKDDEAVLFFRAARRIEPNHVLSDKIAPEGGPLAGLYTQAGEASAPNLSSLRGPSWTTVYVDGERASRYPTDVPSLFQYETSNDGVFWSGLLAPGASFPSADDARALRSGGEVAAPAVADATPAAEASTEPSAAELAASEAERRAAEAEAEAERRAAEAERRVAEAEARAAEAERAAAQAEAATRSTASDVIDTSGAIANNSGSITDRVDRSRERNRDGGGSPKGALLGATVATGVVAAGLFGVSAYSRTQFDDDPTQAKYNLTNGTFFGSVGAAAVTAGLLTATIAVK